MTVRRGWPSWAVVQAASLRRERGSGRGSAAGQAAPGPSGGAVPLGPRADATARGGCVASSFPLRSISFRSDFFRS